MSLKRGACAQSTPHPVHGLQLSGTWEIHSEQQLLLLVLIQGNWSCETFEDHLSH